MEAPAQSEAVTLTATITGSATGIYWNLKSKVRLQCPRQCQLQVEGHVYNNSPASSSIHMRIIMIATGSST